MKTGLALIGNTRLEKLVDLASRLNGALSVAFDGSCRSNRIENEPPRGIEPIEFWPITRKNGKVF